MSKEKECQVCNHPDRREIEASLFDGGAGNSLKQIADRCLIRSGRLLYHKENHMVDCAKQLVEMVNKEYEKKMMETGVQKAMSSIEILDLVIARGPELLKGATLNDVLRAVKLKADLTGSITQKQVVELSWLNEIPDKEKKKDAPQTNI